MSNKTIIFYSFPTPNGPMHLGHLSGPFVAADIYGRFLEQQGKQVIRLCGVDQNQTWSGIMENDVFYYTSKIKKSLSNFGIQNDWFVEPILDLEFKKITVEIFNELLKKGILFSKRTKAFTHSKTKQYMADCEILGNCPKCHDKIRGNLCEQCSSFINELDIVNPSALDPTASIELAETSRIYFPLSRYQSIIEQFIKISILNPRLREICLDLISEPLPDIPITNHFPWGTAVKPEAYSEQFIGSYFEHVTRLIYVLKKNAITSTQLSEYQLVRFFGIDNAFMYCLLAPALIYAYDPLLLPRLASNANQFYLLGNKKFSTSQNNAVWADEFLTEWGSDISRLYLAYTRPEECQSEFVFDEFRHFYTNIKNSIQNWLNNLFEELKREFHGKIPIAALWNSSQKKYYLDLQLMIKKSMTHLQLTEFSTKKYVEILLNIINCVTKLKKKHLGAYSGAYQTNIALQVWSAYILAIISWPVMPDFSSNLYKSLGFKEEIPMLDNEKLFQLLPEGQSLLDLPSLFFESIK